ncbi:MAG TPA: hypothetical protein VGG70_04760 [Candidatus Cybelea sp.]
MSSFWRAVVVVAVGLWSVGSLAPKIACTWEQCPDNGLDVTYDGVVIRVDNGSPAAKAGINLGDRIVSPLPRGLTRDPPQTLSFNLLHGRHMRAVTLHPVPANMRPSDRLRLLAVAASYLLFVVVGSALVLLRPSAMTWAFYGYCILRRYGDLLFYWPGSSDFFWVGALPFAALGGAGCVMVMMFALRFPTNTLLSWRRATNVAAIILGVILPVGWLYLLVRFDFLGLPSASLAHFLVRVTSAVYLAAAAVFIITLFESHGDQRQRLQWVLVFPAVLILRVIGINLPYSLPPWYPDALVAVGALIPLTVAYAVIRRRVFDVQFVISRALVYGTMTTLIAGAFLLLDWFMSKQFEQTRFTLTAEIIFALALGSSLNMLHHNVDRLVDGLFFRQRHFAERRLARAAAAVTRAETFSAVDRFVVHEPVEALDLISAALFRKSEHGGGFARRVEVGWDRHDLHELGANDPLVLHLLAEGGPVRISDVAWSSGHAPHMAHAVLAMPLLLRDQIVAIALYGPHHTGADIDPDERKSLTPLLERAGAAYDHIDAQALRAKVELLTRERELKDREIARLRAEVKGPA